MVVRHSISHRQNVTNVNSSRGWKNGAQQLEYQCEIDLALVSLVHHSVGWKAYYRHKTDPLGASFRTIHFQVSCGFYLNLLHGQVLVHLGDGLNCLGQCLQSHQLQILSLTPSLHVSACVTTILFLLNIISMESCRSKNVDCSTKQLVLFGQRSLLINVALQWGSLLSGRGGGGCPDTWN